MNKFMVLAVLTAAVVGCSPKVQDDGKTVRECVERVTYRTELHHQGCNSNGFWRAYGAPQVIEAYGIDKALWPHRCSGCSETNTIYDARWPKFETEWRAVK